MLLKMLNEYFNIGLGYNRRNGILQKMFLVTNRNVLL